METEIVREQGREVVTQRQTLVLSDETCSCEEVDECFDCGECAFCCDCSPGEG